MDRTDLASPRPTFFHAAPFATEDRAFLSRLKAAGFSPRTIFDVGAAGGSWTSLVAAVFPGARYELFEPLAGRFPEYDRTLEPLLRRLPSARVHPVALSDRNARQWFWVGETGLGSSLLNAGPGQAGCVEVDGRRLDDYARERGLEQPQVVKADVQAAEMLLIRGGAGLIAGADVLMLETHLEPTYGAGTPLLTDLVRELAPMGFRLIETGGVWRPEHRGIVSIDGFFVHDRLIARLPGDERAPSRRIADALSAARERGRTRAALYGAGQHTRGVERDLDTMPLPVVAVIDDDPGAQRGQVRGRPVVPRSRVPEMGVDIVVLSSDVHEDALWRASADLRARGVEVVRLYGE